MPGQLQTAASRTQMNTPKYIASASLLLWTTLTGFWVPGILLIVLAESYRWIDRRWAFEEKDDKRFVNSMILSLVVGVAYSWLNPQGSFALLETIQIGVGSEILATKETFRAYEFIILILPILFFPIFWATRFRVSPQPTFSIFSRYLPSKIKSEATWINKKIPADGGYAIICAASACKTQSESLTFFVPFSILVLWFLFENRPGKKNILPWIFNSLFAVVIAFFVFSGLNALQAIFQEKFINYIAQLTHREVIPDHAKTMIGKAGKIRLSGKIVARAETNLKAPFLLQQDFYNKFTRGEWHMSNFKTVTNVLDDGDFESWTLRLPLKSINKSKLKLYHSIGLDGGRLPLPMGAFRLSSLPVGEVLTNIYGRVTVVDGPGLLTYEVDYSPSLNHLARKIDLTKSDVTKHESIVGARETKAVEKICRDLDILKNPNNYSEKKIAEIIANYFIDEGFRYSTELKPEELPRDRNTSAISYFLENTKKGHCEYFATATTLLLRKADVPARYVVGYSVTEKKDDKYIIRERDSHAWCQYYVTAENKWYDLDTTPAEWRKQDRSFASSFEPITDFLSHAQFQASRVFWIWVRKVQEFEVIMGILLVLFFGFLIFRIMRHQKQSRAKLSKSNDTDKWEKMGMDSAFFSIIGQLEKMGYHRADGETLLQWISNRIPNNKNLLKLAQQHNQYRFDPAGFPESKREIYFSLVDLEFKTLVEQYEKSKKPR